MVAGTTLSITRGLEACADADLIALPSGPMDGSASPAVVAELRKAADRGAYVLSGGLRRGPFTLAAAGVLAGRRCSTHWRYADALASAYPDLQVDSDALYTRDGNVITSAGTAAGIDACLSLVRAELGSEVAARIACWMVVAPHRDGGQRQFIELGSPCAEDSSMNPPAAAGSRHTWPRLIPSRVWRRGSIISARTFARQLHRRDRRDPAPLADEAARVGRSATVGEQRRVPGVGGDGGRADQRHLVAPPAAAPRWSVFRRRPTGSAFAAAQ